MASGTINKYMDGTDSGWKNLPESTTYTGTIKYRRIGSIFQVKNTTWIKLTSDLASGAIVLLGTIPESDKPATMFGNAYWNIAPYPILAVKIENGSVRLYNSSSVTITANTNLLINAISFV